MDIDVEKLNELIVEKLQLKERFFLDTDIEEFHIALYHGTDQFVLDLSEEERLRYYDALQTYLKIAKREITIIPEKVEGVQEDKVLSQRFAFIKSYAKNFKYGNLYTTTDLRKIVNYSKNARFFGEIGEVVYCLRKYVNRNQITISIDPETENALSELYSRIESNVESRPVYLKTFRIDKVVADENGNFIDEEAFRSNVLIVRDNGDFRILPKSFRMSEDLSLRDFEIIDYEKEKELLQENKIRVKEMYKKYIEEELNKIYNRAESAIRSNKKEIGTMDDSAVKELVIKILFEQFEEM